MVRVMWKNGNGGINTAADAQTTVPAFDAIRGHRSACG